MVVSWLGHFSLVNIRARAVYIRSMQATSPTFKTNLYEASGDKIFGYKSFGTRGGFELRISLSKPFCRIIWHLDHGGGKPFLVPKVQELDPRPFCESPDFEDLLLDQRSFLNNEQ